MKRVFFLYLAIISISASTSLAEFGINTRVVNHQEDAAIAMDANENFVVVWRSYLQDGSSWGIFGQRFDRDGHRVGNEFQINTVTPGNQTEPAVGIDAVGNFVVAWQGPGVSLEDVFAQRFDANGQPLGDEFGVNTCTDGRQLCPSVAMNNDGNCVIVWESTNIPEEGKRAICGRLYDSCGSSVGDEFVVNDEPSTCRYPDVAMYSSGKFVIVWIKESGLKSVWVRHFDANGSAPYLSYQVNDVFNFTSLTRPSVAIDAEGGYVIAWDGDPDSYLEDDIYLKRYHWSHAPLHDQFVVNTYEAGAQSNPSVAMSADGEFIVVWQSDTAGTGQDIFGQRFPSQGEHIGEPILLGEQSQINTYAVAEQERPAVAMKDNGEFITVWQSYGQDGSGYGVFGELGPKIRCADFGGDLFVNLRDYCVLAEEWLKEENPLEADLNDDNRIDERDLAALCEQWLKSCYECSEVDIDSDGRIDLKDYALWAGNWSEEGPNLDGDITGDGTVDMADLRAMMSGWLDTCEQQF